MSHKKYTIPVYSTLIKICTSPMSYSLVLGTSDSVTFGCPQKKVLFPVQRVAVIVASRAAAIFFLHIFFLFGRKI